MFAVIQEIVSRFLFVTSYVSCSVFVNNVTVLDQNITGLRVTFKNDEVEERVVATVTRETSKIKKKER